MSELFSDSEIHHSWKPFFALHNELIAQCFASLPELVTPPRERILRVFTYPKEEIRVLIVGQDPYPGFGVADGLAFSAQKGQKIPASLRNIFKEYIDDLGFPAPSSPDLTRWAESGVALLNRTLTTVPGERNAHLDSHWRIFTLAVACELAEQGVVAILWGSYAAELAPYFTQSIVSVHPSPLSARKGFFGSRPFSLANAMLRDLGKAEINWQL